MKMEASPQMIPTSYAFYSWDGVDNEFPFPASWVLSSPNMKAFMVQANVEDINRILEYIVNMTYRPRLKVQNFNGEFLEPVRGMGFPA
jgi:hypothetical protein